MASKKSAPSLFSKTKLIGVLHLPGLPGSPSAIQSGDSPWEIIDDIGLLAIKEAQALAKAGFQALIIENFGDVPFYKSSVPSETISALTMICAAVRAHVKIPLGLNVLRNDAVAALSIASSTGLDFIRVNVLNGVAATDQGLIEGCAEELLRKRALLKSNVKILADVHVKHAQSLIQNSYTEAFKDAVFRGGADALIISGSATGEEVSSVSVQEASEFIKKYKVPVFIGSGATDKNCSGFQKKGLGIIVGSFLRKNGLAGAPLESKNIQKFISSFKKTKK